MSSLETEPELSRIESHVERVHARAVDKTKQKLANLRDREDQGAKNRVPMLEERLEELQQVDLQDLVKSHQERYLRRREKGFSRRYVVDFGLATQGDRPQ